MHEGAAAARHPIVLSDPLAYVGSSGRRGLSGSVTKGGVSPQAASERPGVTSQTVSIVLRSFACRGMRVFMFPAQDVRGGGRQSSSSYQYTLWSPNLEELLANVPRVVAKVQTLPELVDVTTDREQNGLQANMVIDRPAASRYGVKLQDIDNTLNNAFAQRQISTIYSERNQYRVILEVDPQFSRDPSDLTRLYVAGAGGVQVPMSSVARVERGLAPLVINHQGSFPSVTVTYNLAPNITLSQGQTAIDRAVAELHLPIRSAPSPPATQGWAANTGAHRS